MSHDCDSLVGLYKKLLSLVSAVSTMHDARLLLVVLILLLVRIVLILQLSRDALASGSLLTKRYSAEGNSEPRTFS